jgi:hypothetical protein
MFEDGKLRILHANAKYARKINWRSVVPKGLLSREGRGIGIVIVIITRHPWDERFMNGPASNLFLMHH